MSLWQWVCVCVLSTFLFLWSMTLLQHRGSRHALAVWLGWGVPGLGHVMLGRPLKGAVFFLLLAAVYVTGMTMISWRAVAFDDQPFYYIGQYGSGVTWLLTGVLGGEKPFPHQRWPVSWYDAGLLYAAAPGLLNLVLVLNLFQPRPKDEEAKQEEEEEKKEA